MAIATAPPLFHLEALSQAIDDAVITTDLESRITSWNAAAEKLYGYRAPDMMGHSITDLFPADRLNEEQEIIDRMRAGSRIRNMPTVRVRRDGSFVSVSVTAHPVRNADRDVIAIVRLTRDVNTWQRMDEAARRLTAIVESSDDAIISKDLNGTITSWNRAAERMFGYTAAEAVGRSIRILIPDDRQSEEDDVLAALRRGQKIDHFETIRKRKDGTLLNMSLTVSPIFNERGQVIGASKIARDVTERKRLELERARLLDNVQEASRLKDEFLATLSHELRTPLNAILGYSRMIRGGIVAPERQQRAVETIERNAASLTQIVEDVLDVSRIIAGKMRLTVQPVDLAGVMANAVEGVMPAAQARGVRVAIDCDPAAGLVSGDPERLQQIVWNLLSNAVKFTNRGGVVSVCVRQTEAHLELRVADTGIGIPPAFLPYVFERFRQADAGTTRQHGGLGLGLSITRQLVEMHGGRIRALSEGEGKGAEFLVELPRMVMSTEAFAEDKTHEFVRPSAGRIDVPRLSDVKVLAVDDDADAVTMVREILETTGAEIRVAGSAEEALRMLDGFLPDVLVADLGMPRMDGFALIARLRRHPDDRVREIRAVALTAYARSEDRARALKAGFQIHLAKPIDPSELIAAVASLSGHAAAR